MEITHICTTDSLRAGIPQHAHDCFMCGRETMFDDWVGAKCDTCGADTSWEGDYAGLVRSVRTRTMLSRKQFSKLIGLKPSTIKKYEFVYPSKKYYQKFRKVIAEFYNKLGDEGIAKLKEAMRKDDMKKIQELMDDWDEKQST